MWSAGSPFCNRHRKSATRSPRAKRPPASSRARRFRGRDVLNEEGDQEKETQPYDAKDLRC